MAASQELAPAPVNASFTPARKRAVPKETKPAAPPARAVAPLHSAAARESMRRLPTMSFRAAAGRMSNGREISRAEWIRPMPASESPMSA